MSAKAKENRTKKLTVRLTTKEWEQVTALASSQGYTDSDYVRKHLLNIRSRAPRSPMSERHAYDYQRALMIRNCVEQIRLTDASGHVESFLLQIEAEAEQLQNRGFLMGECGE